MEFPGTLFFARFWFYSSTSCRIPESGIQFALAWTTFSLFEERKRLSVLTFHFALIRLKIDHSGYISQSRQQPTTSMVLGGRCAPSLSSAVPWRESGNPVQKPRESGESGPSSHIRAPSPVPTSHVGRPAAFASIPSGLRKHP